MRLLRRHVTRDTSLLEIGCAPGRMLAWAHVALGATVAGLDYSPVGVARTRAILESLGAAADVREEDLFATTFPPASFDVVYSAGFAEHFDDPAGVMLAHLRLARPGGVVLIAIPNYAGIYGVLQRVLDPANLALHNLALMTETALLRSAPWPDATGVRAYRFGRAAPQLLSLPRAFGFAGKVLTALANAMALVQPFDVKAFAPLLVLELRPGEEHWAMPTG
jgi:SAM-dependent methyltransferase